MSHERLFLYDGDDEAYIKFLEWMIRGTQGSKLYRLTDPTSQPKWMNQLEKFTQDILKLVTSEDTWHTRRVSAGIDQPDRNLAAIRLILGCQTAAIFTNELYATDTVHEPATRGDHKDLMLKGYKYGDFMISCKKDRDFAKTVVAFQNLVFCSFCLVISEFMKSQGSGTDESTPAINKMMRAYLDGSQEDKTLTKYRGGAKWFNRCMATLLANGWGYKTWEIFLLEKRSLSMFGRFNDSDSSSHGLLSARLGSASVSSSEPGWMPYCIPCIVHFLTGPTVKLGQVCDILGYGRPDKLPMQPVCSAFDRGIKELLSPSAPTG